jgi:hypothetical protein
MYYDDHAPPHVHACYGNDAAVIMIEILAIRDGRVPRRATAMVSEWAAEHREKLLADWRMAVDHQPLQRIEPRWSHAMRAVRRISARPQGRLEVQFTDATCGEVELRDRLFGPMFEPRRDPQVLGQVAGDDFSALGWPNGAGPAPDGLYEAIAANVVGRK